jgi:hypothetical protein
MNRPKVTLSGGAHFIIVEMRRYGPFGLGADGAIIFERSVQLGW